MIPIKMHMVNFGPYADSSINFDFKSALIVGENPAISGASNGTGKSTIFQALTWVLTGSSRYKNSNSVIRDGADSAKVTLLFKVGDEHYQIIRGRNRNNKQTLDFNKITPDGKSEPVKADTNSKLDDKIAAVTHVRYDSFVNTAYFAQNTISEFMYGTSSVRQKLIAEILSMDRWNAYAKNATTKLAETEKDLDIVRYKISTLGNIEEKKQKLSADDAAAYNATCDLNEKLATLEVTESELRDAAAAEQHAAQAEAARSATVSLIDGVKKNIADYDSRINSLEVRANSIVEEMTGLAAPTEDLGKRPDISASIIQKLAERKGELQILQRRLTVIERGECDTCGSSWKHDHAQEVKKITVDINELRSRISIGEGKLAEARREEADWDSKNIKQASALSRLSSLDAELSRLKRDIEDFKNKSASAIIQLDAAQQRLSNMPIVSSLGDSVAQLKNVQSQINLVRSQLSSAISTRSSISAKLEVLAGQEQEMASLDERRRELEKEVNLYSALAKHFSKTGIQALILDTVVSEIETLSNAFLMRLSHKPFSIKFITQKPDTKGQIKETLDVEVVSPSGTKYIEDLSGGEQFRVAFSIRLALAAVQARRQGGELTMLLLDEVSSSLDKVGVETFVSIVKELQKSMIVMLITHDDSLKEHFDNVIKVRNDGQVAKIIQ